MLCNCYGHSLTKGAIIQIFYRGLDDLTQGILDAGGIFLYNTPNEAFKILKDKVLLKLDFSDDSQNPKPKTIISIGGSNIDLDHAILVDKFEALATKINSECLIIRKELKEIQDDRRDNHASQIYMSDDTPMCDPMEVNYVKERYHEGYHDRNSRNLYSYQNRNPNLNRMPHPSQYFKTPEASTEEMIREWMARQMEVNERMKNQVVELESRINQGLKKPPSNYRELGEADCAVHIPYTNAKTFADNVLLNHVGDKEFKLIDGVGIGRMKNKEKEDNGVLKEPNKELKLNDKVMEKDAWRKID
ncbi:hypothetical protein Tco_0962074 [Tanacetum coccineum]